MSRKKTRKEKIKSAKRRETTREQIQVETLSGGVSYSLDDSTLKKLGKLPRTKLEKKVEMVDLFEYDPKLLSRDIWRTVLLSLVIFSIEAGIFWYLR